MAKRMLIDATHEEETRVAITDGNKLIEYDYESQSRKPLKGSIFLAKVTRVEPSLQAAFVNFGGNRHGFLPFSEIHPDYFRIPVSDREALMAEQEELLKQHDDEEAEDDSSDVVDGDDSVEDEVSEPEEVGGDAGSLDEDDAQNDEAAPVDKGDDAADDKPDVKAKKPVAKKVAKKEIVEKAEGTSEDAPVADKVSDADESAKGDADAEKTDADSSEKSEKTDGDENKGKRGRGGYRGRGRGRGRGRAQSRNDSVEVVGGEEIDDEQRFRFNLRRKYKIQEVIKRGQIMLVQVNKEERGNKGAAVGSYLSLPGRYCVLMPNSPRAGGVSRKIANHKDRARMRDIVKDLEVPKGMSVIVRTAGVTRTKVEIKRDLDYLMRLWDNIRDLTLESTAPAMVYEEADLIKRAVRDLYTRDVEDIMVSGKAGFKTAQDFMKMMIPSHVKKVSEYKNDQLPLFHRYQIESQIDEIGQVEVRLKSGGYLVINPTEALVSVDVNSGKATKGRHIEETALKTNLEAADEVARQLCLRDLGGLVVIDFIDMEDRRNNGKVERRMKDALSTDRARVQVGRISSFGLMELSRQRLSPSLTEAQYEKCNVCSGLGLIRTADAMSILVLRAIEEEGIRARAAQIIVQVTANVALYLLNYKRKALAQIEERYGFEVLLRVDDSIPASDYRVEVSKPLADDKDGDSKGKVSNAVVSESASEAASAPASDEDEGSNNRRRRGRRGGRNRSNRQERGEADGNKAVSDEVSQADGNKAAPDDGAKKPSEPAAKSDDEKPKRKPRRSSKKSDDKAIPAAEEDAKAGNVAAINARDETSVPANDEAVKSDDTSEKKPARKRRPAKKTEDKSQDNAPESKSAVKSEPKTEKKAVAAKKPAAKAETKAPLSKKDEEPSVASQHETVNQAPKKKKKGWWNR